MKIVTIDKKSSYALNDVRDLNKIFRKDMAYDNVKSYKKAGFHPLSRSYIFVEKPQRGESY